MFPAGEGAVAEITLFYRGNALDPVRRILQRTVFSQQEIEKSVSYERERRQQEQARAESDGDESGSGIPRGR
jgi:hypothetical protein